MCPVALFACYVWLSISVGMWVNTELSLLVKANAMSQNCHSFYHLLTGSAVSLTVKVFECTSSLHTYSIKQLPPSPSTPPLLIFAWVLTAFKDAWCPLNSKHQELTYFCLYWKDWQVLHCDPKWSKMCLHPLPLMYIVESFFVFNSQRLQCSALCHV